MASVHSFVGRRFIIMSPPLGPSVRIIPSNRRYRVILIAIVISNIRMLATATFNVIDSMFACPIVLHIGWVRSCCCCCCSFCFLSFFLALSLSLSLSKNIVGVNQQRMLPSLLLHALLHCRSNLLQLHQIQHYDLPLENKHVHFSFNCLM